MALIKGIATLIIARQLNPQLWHWAKLALELAPTAGAPQSSVGTCGRVGTAPGELPPPPPCALEDLSSLRDQTLGPFATGQQGPDSFSFPPPLPPLCQILGGSPAGHSSGRCGGIVPTDLQGGSGPKQHIPPNQGGLGMPEVGSGWGDGELPWLRLPEPGGSWAWPGPGSPLCCPAGAEPTQPPRLPWDGPWAIHPCSPACEPDGNPSCPRRSENIPELRDFT